MIALLGMWPYGAARPSTMLTVEYNPPRPSKSTRRPSRKAPGGIRACSLDAQETADLAALIAALPTTGDRR